MSVKRRKDSKNRILKEGEYERSNKTYEFKWTDKIGKRHSIYAKTLEELREKEFDERAERAERIQNTISLFRKIACVLAVMIAAAFIFFHVRKDYNNYAGSQLVMAEVINVEGADDENINVTYRYNIADKEYESDKIQYTEKIKKGDKKEIRVKKNNPEIILKHNDINLVIFYDVMIGLCLGLTVLCLYEMATNGLIFPL